MPDTAENTIQSLAAGLPAELKGAVQSVPIAELIYAIGRKHGLAIDKIGNLAQEIAWFISGKVRSQNFIPDLLLFLDADHGKAAAIAAEVNDKIFTPIRDALRSATVLPPTPLAKPPPSPPPRPPAPPPPLPPTAVRPPPPPSQPVRPVPPAAPREAPIIRPLGVMPTEGDRGQVIGERERKLIMEEGKPRAPVRPEPVRVAPPPPAPPPPRPAAPPSPPRPTPPQTQTHPPAAPVITRAELEQELERFRQQPRGDGGQVIGDREQVTGGRPGEERPIKLPTEKIPKPSAPEKYTVDPYKEPVE